MTGYERIILLFDTDPTAFEFMREDGEGGFAGSIFRMAREIDRLRSARAGDNIALQAEVDSLHAQMSILSPLYRKRLALSDENAKLREALAFYVKHENWCIDGPLDGNSPRFTGGPAKETLATLNATPDTAAVLPG